MVAHSHSFYMDIFIACFFIVVGFPPIKTLLCIGGTAVRDQIERLRRYIVNVMYTHDIVPGDIACSEGLYDV